MSRVGQVWEFENKDRVSVYLITGAFNDGDEQGWALLNLIDGNQDCWIYERSLTTQYADDEFLWRRLA